MTTAMMEQFNASLTENFFQESTTDVFEKYDLVEEARIDELGPIRKVTPKDSSTSVTSLRVYSLKTIHLNRVSRIDLQQEELRQEIKALKALDHPNIIKLYEVYYNEEDIHMLLEETKGDDLYSRSPYTERQAANISSQLASAVAHMHENGVIHHALRFETIFFEHNGANAAIKVADFGGGASQGTVSGARSIYAKAPEALEEGSVNALVDCWSMGVIFYMLLSGQIPFYAQRSKNMIAKIKRAKYSLSGQAWDGISNGAKHLVANLLLVDTTKRYTSKQILDHIWIRKWTAACAETAPLDDQLLTAVDDSLRQYRQSSILKKLGLNIIAHKSTTQEIIALRKVFDSIDKSHNGTVDFAEFKQGLGRSGFTEQELAQIFESIDVDHSGQIQYTEFLAATLEARGYLEEDRIAEAFAAIDRDGSGFIDKSKLTSILGQSCTSEQIDEIIKIADKNNDGKISYDEFFDVFRDQTMILAAQIGEVDEPTDLYDDDDFADFSLDFDPNSGM
ncbi:MAP kinase-activated protein kinase 2 (Fragment) [Seminavis robusta]|uniref:MAP kinase-activated protein kinase 2 n=1 Tax=Seminavis robusta TaxID=568900 RepID=A0A9N8EVH6_9STRA